jgi:group I intron endonuclease
MNISIHIVDVSILLKREQWYIENLNTLIPNGFNIAKDTIAPMRGRKHSQKTKDKLRILNAGCGNGMYGKKHSDYSKRKISITSKKNMTDRRREILSGNARKRVGQLNPFYGKNHSNEFKDKVRKRRQALDTVQVKEIRDLLKQNMTHKAIANKFSVSRTVITNISLGNTYEEEINGQG